MIWVAKLPPARGRRWQRGAWLGARRGRGWSRGAVRGRRAATRGDAMTTLLWVRHGEVPGISPPRFRGRQELELTERGRAQAQRTAGRVQANWPQVAAIYCSPRHRTVATAQAIGRPHALEPKAMPELDDFDYGTWQGASHEEARERWPEQWSLWTTAPESVVFPQGETLAEVAARVGRGLHTVLEATRELSGA